MWWCIRRMDIMTLLLSCVESFPWKQKSFPWKQPSYIPKTTIIIVSSSDSYNCMVGPSGAAARCYSCLYYMSLMLLRNLIVVYEFLQTYASSPQDPRQNSTTWYSQLNLRRIVCMSQSLFVRTSSFVQTYLCTTASKLSRKLLNPPLRGPGAWNVNIWSISITKALTIQNASGWSRF